MTNLPFNGQFRITCEYGRKNTPNLSWSAGYHTGVDIVGDTNTTVYCVCDGTVLQKVTNAKGYGNYVTVRDSSTQKVFLFAHLASFDENLIVGKAVNRATKIGVMGRSGLSQNAGKHLHIELRSSRNVYGEQEDPTPYMMGISNPIIDHKYNSADFQISTLNISYDSYCQNILWHGEKHNWEMSGPYGNFLRIEAVIINADIPVQYRVHMEGIGWGPWVPNGCMAGTTGESRRVEAIEIQSSSAPLVGQGYVENIGFQNEVRGTQIVIGTTGQGLRLEGFRLKFA